LPLGGADVQVAFPIETDFCGAHPGWRASKAKLGEAKPLSATWVR
jgi:hypothetical protein